MIAFESFVKSCPRFASAAPFLCLIVDHLLCPDTRLLSDQFQEPLMDAGVAGQLRMERRDQEASLAEQHGPAVVAGEHLDVGTCLGDPRRTDEDAPKRLGVAREREISLEARDLAAVA